MINLYLFASLLTTFLMISDIFILIHPHLPIKKYPIFILSIFTFFFTQIYLNFSPLILLSLTVTSFLLVKFSGKLYSFFYIPLGYILDCIICNLIGFVVYLLWEITIQDTNADSFLMFLVMFSTWIVSCPVLYLIRLLLQRYVNPIFESMSKKLFALISVTVLLCAFMIFTMASLYDNREITPKEFFFMSSSLVLYFLFTVSLLLIVIHGVKKNYEAQEKVKYLENLNEYTKNLEMVYNNLSSFRHDYINIMTSLAAYIDEKKYEELSIFFHDHILPMQKELSQKNGTLNSLLHIHMLELKSILYTKLLLAINQNITVTIDIPDEIDEINTIHIDPIDLTRMLGIYLDNAIEASLETEHPTIHFHLGKMNEDIVFIISNTFIDKGLSISQMYKKEVTTKETGHGIGLYNVSVILNRYNNIYHETFIEDGLFTQQFQISKMHA